MYDGQTMTADGLPVVAAATNGHAAPEPELTEPAAQPEKRVIITFKKSDKPPVKIEFDRDALSWDDQVSVLKLQERVEKQEISVGEMLEAATGLLSRLTGQDVGKLPGYVVQELMQELANFTGDQKKKAES